MRFARPGRLGLDLALGASFVAGDDPFVTYVERCAATGPFRRRVDPDLASALVACVRAWWKPLRALDVDARLVQGDFGLANILVRRTLGNWSVAAVLDWEFACAGSPLLDVGHFLRHDRPASPLREPAFSRGFREAGGKLPEDWRRLARVVDLAALCEILAREEAPDEAVREVSALVHATLEEVGEP